MTKEIKELNASLDEWKKAVGKILIRMVEIQTEMAKSFINIEQFLDGYREYFKKTQGYDPLAEQRAEDLALEADREEGLTT